MSSTAQLRRSGRLAVGPGDPLPAARLPSTDGGHVDLREAATGSHLVLLFYPGDREGLRYPQLAGCTQEACSFRDALSSFRELGARVFGINLHSTSRQREFVAREGLTFPLLSDERRRLVDRLGVPVWKSGTGEQFVARTTVVVRRGGQIAHAFEDVDPARHVRQVLASLDAIDAHMPQASVLELTDERCRDVHVAGGKGASLAAMIGAGLPVPGGFVVTCQAFREAVDEDRLSACVKAGDLENARQLVRDAQPPVPVIARAYKTLGCGAVAVRSSAVAEDAEDTSFAGQHETYLSVEGAAEVCGRVADCWVSALAESALSYRTEKDALDDLGIAVVVQRMVAAVKAGVLFTVDPVRQRRDQMIIEATFGLGDRVVSGELTPAHYITDRVGGVKHEVVAGGVVLTAGELRALAGMGVQLEQLRGGPQDVEWAFDREQLYLLQARPVTAF
jgi:pyruvate,water dikinase